MRLVPPKGGSGGRPFSSRGAALHFERDGESRDESEKSSMSKANGNGAGQNGGVRESDAKGERQSGDVRLPNSRRVYVEREGVRVPFREVSLQPTRLPDGRVEENEAVRVYD